MRTAARCRATAVRLALGAILGFAQWGLLITRSVVSTEREYYHFSPEFSVADPQFRRSLDTLNSEMVGGNSATLLQNGDEIFPAMTRDIREAKSSVNLETYIFQPDEAGRQFAAAMIEAAKRGVEVRFLIDDYGSKLGDLEEPLKAAGVKVRVYRPIRVYSIYKIGKRTHRKLLIVDGKIGYTGGLGIDKRWLGDAPPRVARQPIARRGARRGPDAGGFRRTGSSYRRDPRRRQLLSQDHSRRRRRGRPSRPRGNSSSVPKMLYYSVQSAQHSI